MDKLDLLYQRRSIRRFKETGVPINDLREIIKAATFAPSGKNLQNWHFVVVVNKHKIAEMAAIVERKNADLAEYLQDASKKRAFRNMVPYHTAFRNAPVVILVYAGPYPTIAEDLAEDGLLTAAEVSLYARANPGIQNIAAAMQNLLLAATAFGYGTCWMTGPTYAAEEITKLVGFDEPGYYLAALTPLGIPDGAVPVNPPRKKLEEIMTVVE